MELNYLRSSNILFNIGIWCFRYSPIKSLAKLKTLFFVDNKINSLAGIEHCALLTQVNCQGNHITSIKEVEQLNNLEKFNCSSNTGLTSLAGISPAHGETLEELVALPNSGISPAEIHRVEFECGLFVKRG